MRLYASLRPRNACSLSRNPSERCIRCCRDYPIQSRMRHGVKSKRLWSSLKTTANLKGLVKCWWLSAQNSLNKNQ